MNSGIAVVVLDFFTSADENLLTGSIPLSTVSGNVVIFIELFLEKNVRKSSEVFY